MLLKKRQTLKIFPSKFVYINHRISPLSGVFPFINTFRTLSGVCNSGPTPSETHIKAHGYSIAKAYERHSKGMDNA
jgi:hypothetical protein